MSTVQTQDSSSTAIDSTKRVAWNRLWLAGLIVVVGSVIVNVLIRLIALAVLPIPAASLQLSTPTFVIAFTLIGTLIAVGIFALMNRSARNPIRLFRIVASIVLVISFIPTSLLLSTPNTNIASVGTLLTMHVATYLICVGMLTGMTRAQA